MEEEWRPLNGEFDGWPYEVSNSGNVRRIRTVTGKPMLRSRRSHIHKTGYLTVLLHYEGRPKQAKIHRLVLSAFVGVSPSDVHVCNHKDGNKLNNLPDNLEWVTVSGNAAHAYRTGLNRALQGSLHKRERALTRDQVMQLRESPEPASQVAKRLGVSETVIRKARKHQTYKGVC